jgi:serine/threonine protein kinase/Tfp pilus assembly protein PilF
MTPTASLDDPLVVAALEEYMAALEAGTAPDRDAFLARHGPLAATLAVCLDGLEMVRAASPGLRPPDGEPAQAPEAHGRLGDFRLLREVGRGGMGVVYEAEQLSLNRRVALKVLPFAAALDSRQLQRFHHEAQAAASLHHTNIVPVYGVGCERGVHFYVMQYIEGRTLAAVIAELRQQRQSSGRGSPAGGPSTPLGAALSTEHSALGQAYYRTVARLGVQAAEALEHAHQVGIVHRDIKPANLLLDAAGHLWVADFGLARGRGEQGLTLTGDMVGTLRYMSPEQALAKRGLIDHRSDLCSLGMTLYELLTLTPAYPGNDREELLRQIAEREPPPPRRLAAAVPKELETIVLKAMAREPEARYATAQELADDLRRFLEDRPIQAARPGVRERLSKWARQHRSLVRMGAVVLVLAALGLPTSTLLIWQEKEQTKRALEDARVQRGLAEDNFRKALDGMYGLLWELENPRWRDTPELRALRQELTSRGLRFFQQFVHDGSTDPALRFQTARAYELMSNVHSGVKQFDRTLEDLHRAAELYAELVAELPDELEHARRLGAVHYTLGTWYFSFGRHPKARTAFNAAIEAWRAALRAERDGRLHNNLALLLADCPEEELRDPAEAVVLARRALDLAPRERAFWNTLGIACYRAGDTRGATDALNRSCALSNGGDPNDFLFLAMLAWRAGDRPRARQLWVQSLEWMKRGTGLSQEMFRARLEAARMLGEKDPGPPAAK